MNQGDVSVRCALRRFSLGTAVGLLLVLGATVYARGLHRIIRESHPGVFDDAYMFARYARNLIDRQGFTWNPGDRPVYGPTSVLYVLIVAAAMALTRVPTELLLPVVSWTLGAAALVAMAVAAATAARTAGLAGALAATVALAWAARGLAYHGTTGMDTTLSVLTNALLSLVMLRLWRAFTVPWLFVAVLAAYASTCARPDSATFAILGPALVILLRTSSFDWRHTGLYVGVFASLLFFDCGLRVIFLGGPLPLGYYVKQQGYYGGYAAVWNPLAYLREFARATLPCWLVLTFGARRRHLRMLAPFLVPVALALAYEFTRLQVMGFNARFYYPALPFAYAACVTVVGDLEKNGLEARDLRRPVRLVVSALLVLAVSPAAKDADNVYERILAERQGALPSGPPEHRPGRSLPALDWWSTRQEMSVLAAGLPEGSSIAATEVGYLGMKAPRVAILDMAGLNDADFAHHGFSVSHLLTRLPDLVWLPHEDYTKMVRDLLCSDEFYKLYDVYPGAWDFGIAVCVNSPRVLALRKDLEQSWSRSYPGEDMTERLVHAGKTRDGTPFKDLVDCSR